MKTCTTKVKRYLTIWIIIKFGTNHVTIPIKHVSQHIITVVVYTEQSDRNCNGFTNILDGKLEQY